MKEFYKYHGAGNDFIVIDNRNKDFDINDTELIKLVCHRHFGVGADGMLILENSPDENHDFSMVYINNDGSRGAMCGNGGRCIVHFAHYILKIIKDIKKVHFLAVDGEHKAIIEGDEVRLKMQDVNEISKRNGLDFLYSGTTPHNVSFVEGIEKYPVVEKGRRITNSDPDGVNTNFVEIKDGIFHVRTYERGIEDETFACGTGATSVAIASHSLGKLKENICHISTLGGNLTIEFEKEKEGVYKNIWLTGPAKCVFKGELKN